MKCESQVSVRKLMKKLPSAAHLPIEIAVRRIYLIRGQRVMLDADLAELYHVPTKVLNQLYAGTLAAFQPTSCFS